MIRTQHITTTGRAARAMRGACALGGLALAALALSACTKEAGPDTFVPNFETVEQAFKQTCIASIVAGDDRAALVERAEALGYVADNYSAAERAEYIAGDDGYRVRDPQTGVTVLFHLARSGRWSTSDNPRDYFCTASIPTRGTPDAPSKGMVTPDGPAAKALYFGLKRAHADGVAAIRTAFGGRTADARRKGRSYAERIASTRIDAEDREFYVTAFKLSANRPGFTLRAGTLGRPKPEPATGG
jgi:hypothetical protein